MSGEGDYSQLTDRLLAQGALDERPQRCGIHDEPIVDRRCVECDAERGRAICYHPEHCGATDERPCTARHRRRP